MRKGTGNIEVDPRDLTDAHLSLALDAAELGSWTWDMASGVTTWDAQLEAMHGLAPGEFGGTFDDWIAALHPADREECLRRVDRALAAPGPYSLMHRSVWPDGSLHVIECRGTVLVDDQGRPTGTIGVAIDVTMREQVVHTLQQTLLPTALPQVPGCAVGARYRAATGHSPVGGDWYAVIALPDRRLGLAIGDVAGHGLEAISDMAAARFGLRALALTDPRPDEVLRQLNRVVQVFESDALITALYGVLDLDALTWTYASAGHVPAVLRCANGRSTALDTPNDPPLGLAAEFRTHTVALDRGSSLLLYTDGLVERRGESLSEGIRRLLHACDRAEPDPGALCDRVIEMMIGPRGHEDDVAVLAASLAG